MSNLINSWGVAEVNGDPNTITKLQGDAKNQLAMNSDGSNIWKFVPENPAGSKWVALLEDSTFLHIQSTPSDTWEVTHNLNKYPAVTIIDSAGDEVKGKVKYISTSSLTITFVGAFSGKATLN